VSSTTHSDPQVEADLQRYSDMLETLEANEASIRWWSPEAVQSAGGEFLDVVGDVAKGRLSALSMSCKTLLMWH
jgi:hypothetical protein